MKQFFSKGPSSAKNVKLNSPQRRGERGAIAEKKKEQSACWQTLCVSSARSAPLRWRHLTQLAALFFARYQDTKDVAKSPEEVLRNSSGAAVAIVARRAHHAAQAPAAPGVGEHVFTEKFYVEINKNFSPRSGPLAIKVRVNFHGSTGAESRWKPRIAANRRGNAG